MVGTGGGVSDGGNQITVGEADGIGEGVSVGRDTGGGMGIQAPRLNIRQTKVNNNLLVSALEETMF